VHLVTISEDMVLNGVSMHDRAVDLNIRIRELAGLHHWGVVPWDQLVHGYDTGPQLEGPITLDSIHPTDLGQRVLADAYARALASC
jgi:hypothetical protein